MKKTITLTVALLFTTFLYSQAVTTPFQKLGYDVFVGTSSKGEYAEFHDLTDVVEIGSVLYNTKTKEIVQLLDEGESTLALSSATTAMSIDPHCERYYWISPYSYALNNPIKFIDPDGRDVVITGSLANMSLEDLQTRVGTSITLAMNDEGNITYTKNIDGKLKGDAKRMANILDNHSVTVNLNTINGGNTSTGNHFVGGAFMGNTVSTDADGNTTVRAQQDINPTVLKRADDFVGQTGKTTMHELTEGYAGALISKGSGVSANRAAQADVDNPSSLYNRAHNAATPQTPVRSRMLDARGRETDVVESANSVEYYVRHKGQERVIQVLTNTIRLR